MDTDHSVSFGSVCLLSGSGITLWSSLTGGTETMREAQLRLEPDAPVILGRAEGWDVPYLDPTYRATAIVPSSGQRVLSGTYESSCGRITTEVTETEDATLQVTVRCTDPSVQLVEFTWTDVGDEGVGDRHRIVTPLARYRDGHIVTYDLGSIADADAVHLAAAEEFALERLDPGVVSTALSVRHTGSARRAWTALADSGSLAPVLVTLVREFLDG